jgi:hypothetical protein
LRTSRLWDEERCRGDSAECQQQLTEVQSKNCNESEPVKRVNTKAGRTACPGHPDTPLTSTQQHSQVGNRTRLTPRSGTHGCERLSVDEQRKIDLRDSTSCTTAILTSQTFSPSIADNLSVISIPIRILNADELTISSTRDKIIVKGLIDYHVRPTAHEDSSPRVLRTPPKNPLVVLCYFSVSLAETQSWPPHRRRQAPRNRF